MPVSGFRTYKRDAILSVLRANPALGNEQIATQVAAQFGSCSPDYVRDVTRPYRTGPAVNAGVAAGTVDVAQVLATAKQTFDPQLPSLGKHQMAINSSTGRLHFEDEIAGLADDVYYEHANDRCVCDQHRALRDGTYYDPDATHCDLVETTDSEGFVVPYPGFNDTRMSHSDLALRSYQYAVDTVAEREGWHLRGAQQQVNRQADEFRDEKQEEFLTAWQRD